jgi:hypothetical protein
MVVGDSDVFMPAILLGLLLLTPAWINDALPLKFSSVLFRSNLHPLQYKALRSLLTVVKHPLQPSKYIYIVNNVPHCRISSAFENDVRVCKLPLLQTIY